MSMRGSQPSLRLGTPPAGLLGSGVLAGDGASAFGLGDGMDGGVDGTVV